MTTPIPPGGKPFTRAQAFENAAFLKALRRTGNVREACRALGVHRATYTKRRARSPAFAADWDAALAIAHAALRSRVRGTAAVAGAAGKGEEGEDASPNDAEPRPVRTKSGRLQLRRAVPRRLTRAAEQAFLAALSATANVRLSAAAAGFSHSAFYRRGQQSPAFAREMRLALEMGYDRVELALLESFTAAAHADDAWRHADPPPIPPMTPDQALQLLYLHQKEVRLQAEPPHIRRRAGESGEAHANRMAEMYRAKQRRDRDVYDIAEAARQTNAAPAPPAPPPAPPALDQVTGWSKATGQPAHHEGRALFGGWRLGDAKKRTK